MLASLENFFLLPSLCGVAHERTPEKSHRENGCLFIIQQHVIVIGLPARSHSDDAYISGFILTRRHSGPRRPHRAGIAHEGRWHIAPSRTLSMQACPAVGFGRCGLAQWGETGTHGHGGATQSEVTSSLQQHQRYPSEQEVPMILMCRHPTRPLLSIQCVMRDVSTQRRL